jgi:hypothetical protein
MELETILILFNEASHWKGESQVHCRMFVAWILPNEVYRKGLLQNEVEVRRAEVRHAPLSGAARLPVGTLDVDAWSKPKHNN